jgi:hypothetical protein
VTAEVIDLTVPAPAEPFELGDYVAYRDPAKFLLGDPQHTSVARVGFVLGYAYGLVPIVDLASGAESMVDPKFLRLIPADDIMLDLDAGRAPSGPVRLELIDGGSR